MILEETTRLQIIDIKDFVSEPDTRLDIEGHPYAGDRGKVFELKMEIGERPFKILLFDTDFGRKELLTGRFIYGKQARNLYQHCCATVADVLHTYYPDVLGYVEHTREHQILRAGKVMTLAPFIEGLKTQGDDFKRQPVDNLKQMYQARATEDIDWGKETTRIFSDICPASGSTMEAFVEKVLAESQVKKLVFNCSTSTINSLYRVVPLIPENIQVTFIYWEALFSVWRHDITLGDGEVIKAGTVINLNPDPDFPDYNPLAPKEVLDYILEIFQRNSIPLLPDIPGEVGEKIQDQWVGPLAYDFMEFHNAGIDFSKSPWKEKTSKAWDMPGVQEKLKEKSEKAYNDIAGQLEKKTDKIPVTGGVY
ncbi:MAG: hypothetical protein ACLFQV_07880 [Vulcanimicrobiota bacterium]